jgi:hypothetical protein
VDPEHVVTIARDLGVTEQDVVDMNRRLNRDASLNTPTQEDVGRGEWQGWLIDEREDQEAMIAEPDEFDTAARHCRMRCRCRILVSGASLSNGDWRINRLIWMSSQGVWCITRARPSD